MMGLSYTVPGYCMLRNASPKSWGAMTSSPMRKSWVSTVLPFAQASTAVPSMSLNDSLSAPVSSLP